VCVCVCVFACVSTRLQRAPSLRKDVQCVCKPLPLAIISLVACVLACVSTRLQREEESWRQREFRPHWRRKIEWLTSLCLYDHRRPRQVPHCSGFTTRRGNPDEHIHTLYIFTASLPLAASAVSSLLLNLTASRDGLGTCPIPSVYCLLCHTSKLNQIDLSSS
jgi:hypothetical protein